MTFTDFMSGRGLMGGLAHAYARQEKERIRKIAKKGRADFNKITADGALLKQGLDNFVMRKGAGLAKNKINTAIDRAVARASRPRTRAIPPKRPKAKPKAKPRRR